MSVVFANERKGAFSRACLTKTSSRDCLKLIACVKPQNLEINEAYPLCRAKMFLCLSLNSFQWLWNNSQKQQHANMRRYFT